MSFLFRTTYDLVLFWFIYGCCVVGLPDIFVLAYSQPYDALGFWVQVCLQQGWYFHKSSRTLILIEQSLRFTILHVVTISPLLSELFLISLKDLSFPCGYFYSISMGKWQTSLFGNTEVRRWLVSCIPIKHRIPESSFQVHLVPSIYWNPGRLGMWWSVIVEVCGDDVIWKVVGLLEWQLDRVARQSGRG